MATITLRPNAAGDSTQCSQIPDSGYNWDKVDDITPDELGTYVRNPYDNTGADLYNIQDTSVLGNITNVTAYFRINVSSYGSARLSIKTGGTTYTQAAIETTDVWTTYNYSYATNPQTGLAWTWAQINALQIGVTLSAAAYGSLCTQMYVVVDYVPYIDIGIRVRKAAETIKIGVQALEASHKLRIRKGGTTYGIPLLATNDSNASPVRIYDGANVKALPKVA